MLVAIHAYDQIYQGLHGMESYEVVEVINEEEAEDYAISSSVDIMNSYGDIMEELEAEARENVDFYIDPTTDKEEAYDYALDDSINEDVAYDIYVLKNNITDSLEALNDKYVRDPESFIEEFSEREI